MYVVQDQPLPPSEILLLPPLQTFTRIMCESRNYLTRGILDLGYATVAKCTVQATIGNLGGKT